MDFQFRLEIYKFSAINMDGMTDDPPFLFQIFKGELRMIAYAKFNGFLNEGYILNGFRWILNFSCHCQRVEYRTMPLSTTPNTFPMWVDFINIHNLVLLERNPHV